MEPERGRGRATLTIVLLTVAWLLGAAAVMIAAIATGLQGIGLDSEELRSIHRDQTELALWFAGVVAAGPLVVGVVALALRRVVTGWVYLTLAVLLAVPALLLAHDSWRELHPRPAFTPGPPTHCVELSGGDTRCPGG